MCTCIRFSATFVLGGAGSLPLLRKADSTLDDVLNGSECDVVIVCQVNPRHVVGSRQDQIRAVEDAQNSVGSSSSGTKGEGNQEDAVLADCVGGGRGFDGGESLTVVVDEKDDEDMEFDLLLTDEHAPAAAPQDGGELLNDADTPRNRKGRRESIVDVLSKTDNLVLFEMRMDQFEELLAELKVTYSYVASLSQGVSEDLSLDQGEELEKLGEQRNTVQAIFDTVDCDSSGNSKFYREQKYSANKTSCENR